MPGDVTSLLQEIKNGDREAERQLVPLAYTDLRRIAASYLRRAAAGHSLQPAAPVHEAYPLLTVIWDVDWQNPVALFCSFGHDHAAHPGGPCPSRASEPARDGMGFGQLEPPSHHNCSAGATCTVRIRAPP